MTMSTQGATNSSGWRVTSQVEQTEVLNGRIQQGWRVSFITGNGVNGSVWVPLVQYTPANVAAAITPVAAQLDAVYTLAAPPGS